MSKNFASIEALTALSNAIKASFINDADKTEEMKELTNILKEINSKSSIEEYFNNNEKDIQFFINDFIEPVVDNIINQSYVQGKDGDDIALDLLFQIYKLFPTFHKKNYSPIFESIRRIFKDHDNISFFFPLNVFNKPGTTPNPKKKYIFSEFNAEFFPELKNNDKSAAIYNVGDKVDILVNHNESKTDIDKTAWVRGIITKIENSLYYIEYNGEETEITFPIGSHKVQPEGKKTADWEWRTNLKKYDLVDVYDRDIWWPCTICDIVEELDKDGIKKVKYKIGFRLYLNHFYNVDDPEDNLFYHASFWHNSDALADEYGEEFIGDNKDKDEEIYHFSKRIQKFNSFSEIQKQSTEGGTQYIIDDLNKELADENIPEDSNELSLYENNNKKNIIIGKSGNFSYYFACLLKKMENDGDFEKFINIMTDNPNKEELFTIFTIYSNALNYTYSQYFQDNKEILKKAFMNYIEHLDSNEIKNIPRELAELATNFILSLYEKDNPKESSQKSNIEKEVSLNVAFGMIKTDNFEKRKNGLKLLTDYIYKYQNDEKSLDKMCRDIKKNKIIDEIFGPNFHNQILTKSTELLKLLLKLKQLDENDLKLIWSCTQKGDLEVKIIIINIFIELLPMFDDDFIRHLLNVMIGVSDGKPNEKETDFVFRLSSETKSQENRKIICKYFCRNIFELNNFSTKNANFEKLLKLMNNDENYFIQVLELCEEQIKQNRHTLICYSLISELFNNFIIFKPNQEPPYQCLKDSLNKYLKDEHLIKIFEDNFTNYFDKVKERFKSPNINTIEQIFIDGANHTNNVNGRLDFLNSILTRIYPKFDFIFKLKELLLDNPVDKEDKKYFYNFIDNYCFPRDEKKNVKNETRDQAKIKLFTIFAEKDQTEMSYSEFKLFIKTFLYLNKDQLDYQIIQKVDDEFDYDIKLKENINYDEIKEMNILWKMVFEVKDEMVLNKLINVIYQMVQDKSIIIQNIVNINEEDQTAEKYVQCYKLLKIFFIESEKNVLIDIKSHNSLLKNSIIRLPLEFSNEFLDNKNITELFYDNASLNEVKEALMKKYKIPMEYIEIYVDKDDHTIKLDYTYNNKSLKETIFDNINKKKVLKNDVQFNKIIRFAKKIVDKNDLITINKEFSPRFKNIIKKWYQEFTKGSEKMNINNFASLISKITNTKLKETDEKVVKSFNKYDTTKSGFLTEDDFCKYYLDSLLEDKDTHKLWNHLKNMGYDEYLCKKDEPIEVKHIENNNLFRYNLSVEDFINEFIEHYNTYPEIDYDFIFYLPTNLNIYEEVLFKLNSNDSNLFDNVFGTDENILKQLYYLIIIESILQDIELNNLDIQKIFKNPNNSKQVLCSNKYEPFENYEIEKKIKFVEDFIKNKNYEKLIKYNIDMLNKYKRHQNEVIKKCFRKGLKIMKIIFEAFINFNLKNKNNYLTEDNIYFLDYTHINNALKNKNEVKDIINNYSYSSIFKAIMNYLLKNNNNNVDELYNDCFDLIIHFLAFKDKLLDEFISDEKIKNNFYDLIKQNLSINSLAIIKSLTDAMKKLSYISYSSDNKFISFIYDIMDSIFNSKDNKNLILSNEFLNFFTQINDCIYNIETEPNNKLLLNIIDILVNSINEKDKKKKLKKSIFIKYMELLNRLIDKNAKIKQQISSYTINNETLSSILAENVVFDEYEPKKDNKKEIEGKSQTNDDNKDFILIGKLEDDNDEDEDEDDETLNEKLKQTCLDYILSCLKNKNDINVKREIIKLNKIRKAKKDLSNDKQENNNQMVKTNKNKANINDLIKSVKVLGHVGLKNLGSTCYMNSILQQLYMVPAFRYAIMGANDNDSINPVLRFGEKDDNILHQLQVIFSYLNLSDKQFYEPTYFCHSFKDNEGNPTNPRIQQDSMEFFNNFCEQIEKLLAKTKYKYIINDVFMGTTCSSVICDSCHHISNTFENIYNLSLEVQNINNLNDSLQKFIVPEIIEGYKCDGCNKKVTIQKITSLCKLPNILFIHLKRFLMNYDTLQTEKINSRFEFPQTINLKNVCVEMIQQQNKDESDDIYFKKDEYYEYVLKGVNVHIGQASGGHYISFIDINRDGKGNNMKTLNKNEKPNWLRFNDSQISKYDINNLQVDCFGGSLRNSSIPNTQNAYLLIYERVKKTPIKVLINEKNISEDEKNNVIEFKKDEEESINSKYDISKLNNNINEEELYKKIFHNNDYNEYYKITQFYKILKYAPKFLFNKIKYENKLLAKEKNKQYYNNPDKTIENKIENIFNDAFINLQDSNEIKEKYNSVELNDIINITFFDIFQKAKKSELTGEEKNNINNNMKKIIKNVIKPLSDDNMNPSSLETMLKALTNSNNLEIIFSNDNPIFEEDVVKDLYECITNLNRLINNKNKLVIFNVFENIIKYFKKIKTSPNYRGSNETHPIKYIYNIINDLIQDEKECQTKTLEENLINMLLQGIEKEYPINQTIIFKILKLLIKLTDDYSEILFYIVKKEKDDKNRIVQISYKNQIKAIFLKNNINELFLDKDSELLFILIKILEYKDLDFSDKYNIKCLPSLLEYSIQNQKLAEFFELCYNIIDIRDDICLRRMKQILGFPTMIINPKLNKENIEQKWPIFGAELIKKNDNDPKTEIYKYTCFSKKKQFCILSILLPYSGDKKNNNELLTRDNMKKRVHELLSICLSNPTNYYIFKYLYLLPARSLDYKNAYEELKDIIKDNSSYEIKNIGQTETVFIKKIEYELNEIYKKRYPNNKDIDIKKLEEPVLPNDISIFNPNITSVEEFIGFIPDFIPGKIVKEEIQTIVNTRYLKLIRIEYFTTYYKIDGLKKIINENKEINLDNKNENENKDIDSKEKLNEEEKTITVDISNMDYQKVENKLIIDVSEKLGEKVDKFIIEDGTIQFDENVINSLIRYILINKKPINNRMSAKINLKKDLNTHIKDNVCIPEYLIDYVDKHNYVDFLDINRIKKNEKLLEKDDIFISIDSKAYINK